MREEEAAIFFSRGLEHHRAGRLSEAMRSYLTTLILMPRHADALTNLGLICAHQGRHDEAADCFLSALEINPSHAVALSNLGSVYRAQGDLDRALATYQSAVQANPQFPDAWHNLATLLRSLGRLTEARACFDAVLQLVPHDNATALSRALIDALQGDLRAGFAGFERRWEPGGTAPQDMPPIPPIPRWRGEPLAGRTLLITADQGNGDTIQFARYIPLLAAQGVRVVCHLQKELHGLFQGLPGFETLVSSRADFPPADLWTGIFSLPFFFGTTLETIPQKIPYLRVSPHKVAEARHWLPPDNGTRRVGLVWAGSPWHQGDANRSYRLASLLAPLRGVSTVTLISLQKGPAAIQAKDTPVLSLADRLDTYEDTAAVLEHLDLLITVDTSVAHLAGALGRPAWLLLPFQPDWRWLMERMDSPWYPSLRLYRQPAPRHPPAAAWAPVMDRVAADLRAWATAG